MSNTFVPNFTYDEETDLLSAVAYGVAFAKQLADDSVENKDYWFRKAELFDKIAEKLKVESRNF